MRAIFFLGIVCAWLPFNLWAQHAERLPQEPTTRFFRAAVLIGHTYLPAGESGERMFIPSWGLDIEYWWSSNWGVGVHSDLEMASFLVHQGGDETLERNYPIVTTLDLLWKPGHGWVFLGGPGYEWERARSFALFRLGIEYEWDIGHGLDLAPTVFYDRRQDGHETLSIALGIGKRF